MFVQKLISNFIQQNLIRKFWVEIFLNIKLEIFSKKLYKRKSLFAIFVYLDCNSVSNVVLSIMEREERIWDRIF